VADGRERALQLRIGLFVVASLVVFLAIVYLLGARARYFESKYELVAEFTEVGGLIEGATVRLAGVQIGRVTDVRLAPQVGGKVRVTLSIARRFQDRIRADSEARILTQGLLGDRLVEITQGSSSAPVLPPGGVIVSREPFEVGRIFAEGADTLSAVNRLVGTIQAAVERADVARALEELSATLAAVRRTTERADRIVTRVETGPGLLHALLYEEPASLRRLEALLGSAQAVMDRVRRGDHAVSVLLAPESARAARSLVAAMDALGRGAERAGPEGGLLPLLLYDPAYRSVATDLQATARSLREVTERLAAGRGLLGSLTMDRGEDPMGQAMGDFRAAMANLRAITDRVRAGEGTLGGLIEDPTVYENLAAFLEGAQRSFLLRFLLRSTIESDRPGAGAERRR
jgi:phospholipid/cholesterol/gamma-HCH transport system substrate-binding protein